MNYGFWWLCLLVDLHLKFCNDITNFVGDVSISCSPTTVELNSQMQCQCQNSIGNYIEWFRNNTSIATCSASTDTCFPTPSGYVFTQIVSGSVAFYNLTVSSFGYTNCAEYRCQDLSSPPKASDIVQVSIVDFDSTLPAQITEPGSNFTSGSISITTNCIFKKSDVIHNAKLYKVKDGIESLYENQLTINEDSSFCQSCAGESATKLTLTYNHQEATKNPEAVQFRIYLHHNKDPSIKINLTTVHLYNIAVVSDGGSVSDDGISPKESTGIIVGCVVGVAVICGIYGIYKYKLRGSLNTTGRCDEQENTTGNGNVYDRVTPMQDRTDNEIKELTYDSVIAGNGNVYDRVTPMQDRTDIEMKEFTYESVIAGTLYCYPVTHCWTEFVGKPYYSTKQ